MNPATGSHAPDGSDRDGRALPVTIRIGPDGRVYFHDITCDLLPVASALDPQNRELKRRADAAAAFVQKREP